MNPLKIHYLQHVSLEDLGCIEDWALRKGHILSFTKFYENAHFPEQSSFDWLIIMGGPMGVYNEEEYPWLKAEKEFIKSTIKAGKKVIGICLGAQLIASASGAKVYPNPEKEIGWFPVNLSEGLFITNALFDNGNSFPVFHWHGDTFDLPPDAIQLASSSACLNQAFVLNNNILGLQFHLEVTQKSIHQMITFGKSELIQAKYIQTEQMILNGNSFIQENNKRMYKVLDYLEKQ